MADKSNVKTFMPTVKDKRGYKGYAIEESEDGIFVLKEDYNRAVKRTSYPNWFEVEDEVPHTYGMYDSYGNNLMVSDVVITNVGVACYCTEHDMYKTPIWIDVDWDHKEAGRALLGITHWTFVPKFTKD